MKKQMVYFGLAVVLALSISACGKGSDIKEKVSDKKQQEETAKGDEVEMLISEETAKTIALNYVGISEADAEEVKVELANEDNTDVYIVEFHVADKDYSIKINAYTGEVKKTGEEADSNTEEAEPESPEGEDAGEEQTE